MRTSDGFGPRGLQTVEGFRRSLRRNNAPLPFHGGPEAHARVEEPFPLRRKTTLIDLFFIICGLCKTLFNLGEKPELLTNRWAGEVSVGEGLADSQTLETQRLWGSGGVGRRRALCPLPAPGRSAGGEAAR